MSGMNDGTGNVRCTVQGPLRLIMLDRPEALNALMLDMIRVIGSVLRLWNGDPAIRAMVIRVAAWRGQGDGALIRDFFREEHRLNRRIKRFPNGFRPVLKQFEWSE